MKIKINNECPIQCLIQLNVVWFNIKCPIQHNDIECIFHLIMILNISSIDDIYQHLFVTENFEPKLGNRNFSIKILKYYIADIIVYQFFQWSIRSRIIPPSNVILILRRKNYVHIFFFTKCKKLCKENVQQQALNLANFIWWISFIYIYICMYHNHLLKIITNYRRWFYSKITQSWADWEASFQKNSAYQAPQLRECA